MNTKPREDRIKDLIGEPEEYVDYYKDKFSQFTVVIEVTVNGFQEKDSNYDICSRAIKVIRQHDLDCHTEVVSIEKIKDVTFDWITDSPFDQDAWQQKKLKELGLNENGDKQRPWEKKMPESQQRLVIASITPP